MNAKTKKQHIYLNVNKAKEKSFDFSFGAASIFDPIIASCLLKR